MGHCACTLRRGTPPGNRTRCGRADSDTRAGVDRTSANVTATIAIDLPIHTVTADANRGQLVARAARLVMLELVEQAVQAGANCRAACALIGVSACSEQSYRNAGGGIDRRKQRKRVPDNRLSDLDRTALGAACPLVQSHTPV